MKSIETSLLIDVFIFESITFYIQPVNERWGAPELLTVTDGSHEVDHFKADIFSFGYVLAYTLTGKKPFSTRDTMSLCNSSVISNIKPVSLEGVLENDPLKQSILACQNLDPSARPSAVEVMAEYFTGMLMCQFYLISFDCVLSLRVKSLTWCQGL